jgi:ABC-2 type transport system ATP-binding protein
LNEEAKREIQEVLRRHGSELIQMDNPTMTMEELFLDKIRESEARPGMKSGS